MNRRHLTACLAALGMMVGSTLAHSEPKIVIGLTTPMTGGAASFADPERRGVEMAVAEINAQGGVLGRQLELKITDNRCNPTEGVQTANKLIHEDGAVALIGAFCSSVSLAVMPIAQRAEVPFVIDVSTAPSITEHTGPGKNEWVFRTSVTDDGMANALIDYLVEATPWRKIALVAEDTDYGRGGIAAFQELGKKKGIEIIRAETFTQNTPDFTPILNKVSASKPDAIAVYMLGSDMANFLKQYEGWGGKIPITGRFDPALLNAGQLRRGFLEGSVGVLPYSVDIDTPANKHFATQYQALYKEPPQFQSAYGYEAVYMLREAIERAGQATPAAIRQALTETQYQSMMGLTISFDKSHQAHNNAVILKLHEGKVIITDLKPT